LWAHKSYSLSTILTYISMALPCCSIQSFDGLEDTIRIDE
jgi:hypothetical protein